MNRYTVRVPGCTSWGDYNTKRQAIAAAATANRICRPGHCAYRRRSDGTVEEVRPWSRR